MNKLSARIDFGEQKRRNPTIIIPLTAKHLALLGKNIGVDDRASGAHLPHQLDVLPDGTAELIVRTVGEFKGILELVLSTIDTAEPTPAVISVDTIKAYEGQETYRIQTPTCDYYYHKDGAGFASIIDRDGADWLSFKPWGGSDGIYRGIPNLGYPENVFHPGADTCITKPARVGPLRVTLESASKDGEWACRWHVYPGHAVLTVLKVGHPYWLLYEGTPGGVLEEDKDFCIRSDGKKRPLSEKWDEVLPNPKWICFGKQGLNRMLFLASQTSENADCRDSFWPMEHNMTVFGFGRKGLDRFMEATPATFTIGFCETDNFHAAADRINSLISATDVKIEQIDAATMDL